jgi:hypothetical protein
MKSNQAAGESPQINFTNTVLLEHDGIINGTERTKVQGDAASVASEINDCGIDSTKRQAEQKTVLTLATTVLSAEVCGLAMSAVGTQSMAHRNNLSRTCCHQQGVPFAEMLWSWRQEYAPN